MLITNKVIKFKNLLIGIPKQTKRVWDLAENRWGYKFLKKINDSHLAKNIVRCKQSLHLTTLDYKCLKLFRKKITLNNY